ncbi:hypothetical protein QTH90_03415 [Variovorax sp. J2P1-59]|uniref:hypothetical protein n=1 Tax=Variovorax flavidus TaxID=3053501 RepID=UPI002577A90D|nr:hypothetical protein [Variovorax sp. J2P1-59]MDM0073413.1 hypothetical protein [Variovorax sp. J2P1-59]
MNPALSLVIEEPIAGHYYWMIVRPGGWLRLSPTLINSASGPLPSYQAAQEAGRQALAAMQAPVDHPIPSGFGGAWDIMTMPGALV